MATEYAVLSNCKAAYREETTEGTAPADSATGSEIVLRKDAVSWGFDREIIDRPLMRGHLSKPAPLTGMISEAALTLPVYMHGGASGEDPDYGLVQKHCWGGRSVGVDGTVSASPSPTTTSCTLSGATISAGHIARFPIGSGYEYARILTESSGAITFWPPLTAAPSSSDTVNAGTAYLLKSAIADFSSGSAYFYNDSGPKRWIYSGLKGNAKYVFAVGQPVTIDFEMIGTGYDTPDYTAIGYTWTDPGDPLPPRCLGITIDVLYKGTVASGSSTTAVKVSPYTGPGLEAEIGDDLVIDVGSSVYETVDITGVTNSGVDPVTLGHAAVTAATEDLPAYIRRSICLDALEMTVGNEKVVDNCMSSTNGPHKIFNVDRTVRVANSGKRFKDFWDLLARDQGNTYVDIWIIVGSTANNIQVINIPYAYPVEFGVKGGDGLMVAPVTYQAGTNTANYECFLTQH
jgi:hypothetical protein